MTVFQYDTLILILLAFCLGLVMGFMIKYRCIKNAQDKINEFEKALKSIKIGSEIYVHGYVDEIRTHTVIVKNAGGYFGTDKNEIFFTKDHDGES